MARYVYSVTSGRAHDLRFVPDDYVLAAGEIDGQANVLPTLDSLSTVPAPPLVLGPTLQDVINALPTQAQQAIAAAVAAMNAK